MPIKVQCGSCGASFKAKDELAGRRVKCPKCAQPISIQKPQTRKQPAQAVGAGYNPLLDLLDEEDVRSVSRGPVCMNCGVDIAPGTIICVQCGYNQETGQQLETEAEDDGAEFSSSSSMTDAERLLAKAERDIDDSPISSDEQDFGDGSESYLIAGIALALGVIGIAIGMVIILSMESLAAVVSSAAISLVASVILYVAMGIWITFVALKLNKAHGIACLCSAFLWCVVFGFMQGKTLILPTVILLVTLIMGAATGAYVGQNGFGPIDAGAQ